MIRKLRVLALMQVIAGMSGILHADPIYVATNGGNNVAGRFNTWAGAATNIQDAVALATNGDTVMVSNGVFWVTNTITLSTGITVCGVSGPAATVVARTGASSFRPFWLTHSNALLYSLTVSNGYISTGNGGNILLDNGTVSNCIVSKGYVDANSLKGGGVCQNGGLLTDTLLYNNGAKNDGYAGGLYVAGGVAQRCTIREGTGGGSGPAPQPVYVSGGVLRQSTICSNVNSTSGSGGFTLAGGRMENCLVFGNRATASSGVGGGTVTGGQLIHVTVAGNQCPVDGTVGGISLTAGVVTNCIIWGNLKGATTPSDYSGAMGSIWYSCASGLTLTNGDLADDPSFAGASTGNYRLAVGSICRDRGTNLTDVTVDLAGAVRPVDGNGDGVAIADMGAYEADPMASGDLAVWVTSPSVRQGLEPLTVTLQAVPSGSNTNIVWYGWDIGNDGIWDAQGAGLGSVTTNLPAGRYSVTLQITNNDFVTARVTISNMLTVVGTNLYVSLTGSNMSPYATWGTAATNIMDALLTALPGCQVNVNTGLYWMTDMFIMNFPLTVHGVSGPAATVVARTGTSIFRPFWLTHSNAVLDSLTVSNGYLNATGANGGNILLDNGTVSNCIVTKGYVEAYNLKGGGVCQNGGLLTDTLLRNNGAKSDGYGGGLYVAGGVAQRCTIREGTGGGSGPAPQPVYVGGGVLRQSTICSNLNSSSGSGGFTLAGGRMENCLVFGNRATASSSVGGGTVTGGQLIHVTVAANQCPVDGTAGGLSVTGGAATNCIIWGNLKATTPSDYSGAMGSIWYSCASGLTLTNGDLADDPLFAGVSTGNYRLAVGSICRDRGTNLASVTTDLAGAVRPVDGNGDGVAIADMGAYEADPMASGDLAVWVTSPSVRQGLEPLTVTLQAVPSGLNTNIIWYGWDIGNDGVWDAQGAGLGSVTTNLPAGRYSVTLQITNSEFVTARVTVTNMLTVVGTNLYVSLSGSNLSPYATWGTAATNIMDALLTALPGCQVNVNTGLYWMTDMFIMNFPLTVCGVSVPAATVVARTGASNFHPFWVAHSNALLYSLTVSNGYVSTIGVNGGNILLDNGTVSNCIVTKGYAGVFHAQGGGVCQNGGLLTDTLLRNNAGKSDSYDGGLYLAGGVAQRCSIREMGASPDTAPQPVYVSGGVLRQSTICSNRNGTTRGGFYLTGGRIENCLVFSNAATASGGVGGGTVAGGSLVNCTVVKNSAASAGYGGVSQSSGALTNCIVYFNTGAASNNYAGAASAAWYSCAPELTAGQQGNITNDPSFKNAVAGDYHLVSGSHCIGAGVNFPGIAALDLDGHPRVRRGGAVDMGAYEALPPAGTVVTIR